MRKVFSAVFLMFVASVVTTIVANSARTKAAVQQPQRAGWEYTSVSVNVTGMVAFTTPKLSLSGKTWGEADMLLANGGSPAEVGSASATSNILGQQGWELVTVLKSSNGSTEWWFKRSLPSGE